jgi:drug/metabolite transporter (DMT)-like permease
LNSLQVYILAIGANLTFSTSSMVFTYFAKRFSAMWIAQVKVFIALIAFLVAMAFTGDMASIHPNSLGFLLLSGLVGLCLGDIFLFKAYSTLGASRSLVLFSFEPLLVGIYGFFFLGQIFSLNQTLSVICMIICIFIFMLERNRQLGAWDFKSFGWALLGITLDSIGIMLTRSAYEQSPGLETFQVNAIRCAAAVIGYILISPKSYGRVTKDIFTLTTKQKSLLVGSALFGCFVSLTLYLAALKFAHVGTLTAISITGPIWVSLLECIYHRRLPNPYLVAAFAFFVTGFYLMLIA